jgi:hypothetical protein
MTFIHTGFSSTAKLRTRPHNPAAQGPIAAQSLIDRWAIQSPAIVMLDVGRKVEQREPNLGDEGREGTHPATLNKVVEKQCSGSGL